ncbi:MAG: trigger factor, partial [Armatimonadota bacterium]
MTKKQLPGSELEVQVQLEAGEVDGAYDKIYQEISDQGGIPGFRPGHVPPIIIRRRVGEEDLQEMAWMRLVEEHYPKIIEEHEVEPIDDPTFPDLEELGLQEGEPLEFTFNIVVRPVPEMEQYKGIRVIKPGAEVTDEDVDNAIEQMRQSAAEEIKPDRDAVSEGDIVTADLKVQLEDDDEPLSQAEQEFEIGSGRYDPPIDEKLIGRLVGQTVEIEHEYPEDYDDDDLAGQKATITVTIKELRERLVPDLDDEFAQQEGFEDLEDLKETVREQVQRDLQRNAREEAENSALANILAGTTIDLPDRLVEQAAASEFENFQAELQREGLDMESFTEITGASEAEVRENERTRARAALKLNFVLSEIQKREEIEVEEEDLDQEIERFADSTGSDVDFVRQALELQDGLEDQLRERALRTKILDFILENAEVEEIPRDEWEEAKEAERKRLEEKTKELEPEEDESETEGGEEIEEAETETEEAQTEEAAARETETEEADAEEIE